MRSLSRKSREPRTCRSARRTGAVLACAAVAAVSLGAQPANAADTQGTAMTRSASPGTTPLGTDTTAVHGSPLPGLSLFSRPEAVPTFAWPPAGVVEPNLPATAMQADAARMTAHLKYYFPRVMPQAMDSELQPWGDDAGEIHDGQDYLSAFVFYNDQIGPTGVSFEVFAPGYPLWSPAQTCSQQPGSTSCRAYAEADGSTLLVQDITVPGSSDPSTMRLESVLDYRADGSVVVTEGFNYDPDFGPSWSNVVRPVMNATTLQLARLATDPVLHL
jgi:hypothetical protein